MACLYQHSQTPQYTSQEMGQIVPLTPRIQGNCRYVESKFSHHPHVTLVHVQPTESALLCYQDSRWRVGLTSGVFRI